MNPIGLRSHFPAILVSCIFVLALIYWFSIDRTIPFYDSAMHLLLSYACRDIFTNDNSIVSKITEISTLSCFYPPFTYLFGGICKIIFGEGFWIDRAPAIFFYTLMCASQYCLGLKLLEDRWIATSSLFILLLLPSTFSISHTFGLLDLPLLATIIFSLCCIHIWFTSQSWKATILVVVAISVVLTIKQTGIFFVIPPILCISGYALIKKKYKLLIQSLITAIVPTAILSAWVLYNLEPMQKFFSHWHSSEKEINLLKRITYNSLEYINLSATSLGRLWTATFVLSSFNWPILKHLWLPLISAFGGLIILILFDWTPQARYLLPAMPLVALLAASSMAKLWQTEKFLARFCVVGILTVGIFQYIVLNFSPYPITYRPNISILLDGPIWNKPSELLTPRWKDYGLSWSLRVIGKHKYPKEKENTPLTLCVMSDSTKVSASSLLYLARTMQLNIDVFSCKEPVLKGYLFKMDSTRINSTDFYMFIDPPEVEEKKFVSKKNAMEFNNLCGHVKNSGLFTAIATKKVADGKVITLYRNNSIEAREMAK